MLIFIGIVLEFICCGFVIVSLLRLLKINYFNPIVRLFAENLEPISKAALFFLPPLIGSIIFSIGLRVISLIIVFPTASIFSLVIISILYVTLMLLTVIFWCIFGSVILSWVAPNHAHPLLQIIVEISDRSLAPIRKFMPAAGGVDFTPILGFIILNTINIQILFPLLPEKTRPFFLLSNLFG